MFHALRRFLSDYSGIFAGLVFSLSIPSFEVIQKYTGNLGVVLYLLTVMVVLAVFLINYHRLILLVPAQRFWWLALATGAVLLVLFAGVYPIANVQTPGKGSDGDDAIHLAALALLQGQSPYSQITYLGNPAVNLPGALLLALPFALVGSTALQNVFWLVMLLIVMRVYLQDGRAALLAIWIALILSPAIVHTLVIGTDQLSNSIYVMLAVIGLSGLAQQPRYPTVAVLGMAIVLGIVLNSRANFLLLTPLIFSALCAHRGWRVATVAMMIVGITVVGLTAPLYFSDPTGFTPFNTANKLIRFDRFLPHAAQWIVGLNVLAAIVLAFRKTNSRLTHLLAHCAWVLALPVAAGVLIPSLYRQQLVLDFASYGIFFLFFGLAASWGIFLDRSRTIEKTHHFS